MYSLQIDLLMLCLIQITFALLSFVYQNKTYETPFTAIVLRQHERCLHAINVIRSKYGLNNLTLDDKLTKAAERWALRLSITSGMDHPNNGLESDIYSTYLTGYNRVTCEHAIYFWYKDYESESDMDKHEARTYQALLHPLVKRVGFGSARVTKQIYIVAIFSPAYYNLNGIGHIIKYLYENNITDFRRHNEENEIPITVDRLDGWTPWFDVTKCSQNPRIDETKTQERWCIHLQNNTKCDVDDVPSKRTVSCISQEKPLQMFY